MRAAIYVARLQGEGYAEELAKAEAFCAAHGMFPTRHYPAHFFLNKGDLSAFLAAASCDVFDVVVAPYPDCFPTAVLKKLLASGTGLACYTVGR